MACLVQEGYKGHSKNNVLPSLLPYKIAQQDQHELNSTASLALNSDKLFFKLYSVFYMYVVV